MRRIRTGFTYVELLNVIAIIAVLAAILFPVFAQAREKARQTSCQSNLHQIAIALNLYAMDHNGRFPPVDDDFKPSMAYVKNVSVFRCPSDSHTDPGRKPPAPKPDVFSITGPPPQPTLTYTSYAYRGGLRNDDLGDIPLAGEAVVSDADRGADGKMSPASHPFWHNGGGNRVTIAGSVKWLPRKQWVPIHEKQKKLIAQLPPDPSSAGE